MTLPAVVAALAGAMLGSIAGSFIATLCIRWARGERVARGRSHCDACGSPLAPRDLVPFLSLALAGGRSRCCGVAVDPLHSRVELMAAGLGGLAMALAPDERGAALALFAWLLLPLALLDARHFWLPDRLTVALALAGLVLGQFVSGHALPDRLIGGAVAWASLALLGGLYRRLRGRDGLGMGDAKLFGAIGLWTGWMALAPILLVASLAGLAVAMLAGKAAGDRLPFGTLLAAGAFLWSASFLRGSAFL